MCKLCAIAVRYSRVNQDSIVFNLSQFTQVIEEKQLSQLNQARALSRQQKSSSRIA